MFLGATSAAVGVLCFYFGSKNICGSTSITPNGSECYLCSGPGQNTRYTSPMLMAFRIVKTFLTIVFFYVNGTAIFTLLQADPSAYSVAGVVCGFHIDPIYQVHLQTHFQHSSTCTGLIALISDLGSSGAGRPQPYIQLKGGEQ